MCLSQVRDPVALVAVVMTDLLIRRSCYLLSQCEKADRRSVMSDTHDRCTLETLAEVCSPIACPLTSPGVARGLHFLTAAIRVSGSGPH